MSSRHSRIFGAAQGNQFESENNVCVLLCVSGPFIVSCINTQRRA